MITTIFQIADLIMLVATTALGVLCGVNYYREKPLTNFVWFACAMAFFAAGTLFIPR